MARARIRTIKPEMWQDEKIGALSRDARLLLLGLLTMADDEGRLLATPMRVLGHVFPFDSEAQKRLPKWLKEVESSGIVLFYEHNGNPYAAFRHWKRHQKINRATESELPAPPDPTIAAANAIVENWDGEDTKTGYRKAAIPEKVRRAVAKRYGAIAGDTVEAYCNSCGAVGTIHWPRLESGKPGSWVTFSGLELDHVVPELHGGESTEENIQLLCQSCNRRKGAKLPTGNGMVTGIRDRGNGSEVA